MKISVRVKAGSRVEKIEKITETELVVFVKAPPHEGKANEAVVEALSDYFDLSKSRITIVRGHTSRNKIIEIIQ
ncbi:MAG TPA: DUF167 domain-containing protein [Candidatus Omnitrophota bacterium]|nr:DUF167 domain-containing protein [Candidatus Omnitrophota bacterium]HPT07930.1 DUF167 domain-containing protein [Candidatus Omnitrophota bacterium]